ncbi:penicillin-binding protein 2 [uncultured Micrococcus sp.]|uniref:peptidoglycan D,D-transpeptidase FtsI family protein n=1 Tax=uncultured Micrococcus sp. TaxID=114051 RepID=UPI0025F55A72|nr:penicillin-binding protein 2 [uncultured Micrococcus sp.]
MAGPDPRGSTTVPAPGDLGLRSRAAMLALVALLLLLGLRLVWVQGVDPTGQAAAAMDERLTTQEIRPERGAITDRDGHILAESVRRYDIVADQRIVKDFKEYDVERREQVLVDVGSRLATLADVLDMSEEEVRARTLGSSPYSVVKASVTPEVRDRVMALNLPGVLAEAVDRRTYPNGAVAGGVLGFMGRDGVPLEGLEKSQDEVLSGTPGERSFEVGADGIRIPIAEQEVTPAVDGADLRLTLDKDAQWYAQEAVAALADAHDAEWANAVVMDVRTGELLVLADSTTVDPGDPSATPAEFRTATVVRTPYEPGSTGKAVTMAAAIDATDLTAHSGFEVPDRLEFPGQPPIRDASSHATFEMTVAGIFARSYNTGTVQIAERLSDERRHEYMRAFGIGGPIELGLPYPATSVLQEPEDWDGRQRLVNAFGQGYTVTTVHTAQQFQALANGGVLEPARLIRSTVDADGAEHRWPAAAEQRRVVSEDTARQMLGMMETVVTEGTSRTAAIPGYRVGGKSSTAQVAGRTGTYDGFNYGFTAVAPLDDPRFVVSVSMNRPASGGSSAVVATTASRIMSHLLGQAGVPATGDDPQDYHVFVDDPQERPW